MEEVSGVTATKPIDVDLLIAAIQKNCPSSIEAHPGNAISSSPRPSTSPVDRKAIDFDAGLRLWREESVYRKYLAHFVANYRDCGCRVANLITSGERPEAAYVTHTLKGVAGSLALPEVSQIVGDLEVRLANHTDHDPREDKNFAIKLQMAIDDACHVIASCSAAATRELTSDRSPEEGKTTPRLLRDLLESLDSDNPDVTRPILATLAGRLSAEDAIALSDRIDAFDFRGAEVLAKAMAKQFAIIEEQDDAIRSDSHC